MVPVACGPGHTVVSEKISLTQVIERIPALRQIDTRGRPPVAPAAERPGSG